MAEVMRDFGPVEVVVLSFPGEPTQKVRDVFAGIAANDEIGLLDLVYLTRSSDGSVVRLEHYEVDSTMALGDVELEHAGTVSAEDLDIVADGLEPGTTAAILVIEHRWAFGLVNAVQESGGSVVMVEHIPAAAVRAAVEFENGELS